jgi:hypothetical protein
MGAWGTRIFQDDFAADIKDTYIDLLKYQISDEEAEKIIFDNFMPTKEEVLIDDVTPLFWLAFAAAKWEVGRLDENTKQKAIEVIDNESSLELWEDDFELLAKRKDILEQLKERLLSEQRNRKKFRRPIIKKWGFQVGDVLEYKMTNQKFRYSPNWDKTFYFHVYKITKSKVCKYVEDSDYEEYYTVALFNKATEDIIAVDKLDKIEYKCFWEHNGVYHYGEGLDLYPTKSTKGDVAVIGNLPLRNFKENEIIFASGNKGLPSMDCYLSDVKFSS